MAHVHVLSLLVEMDVDIGNYLLVSINKNLSLVSPNPGVIQFF